MAAFQGAASVVWSAMGAGCGFVPDRPMVEVFQENEEDYKRDFCLAYNHGVLEAFKSHLQPCDVVVITYEQTKYSLGFGIIPYFEETQRLVKSKGAKLVIIGDTAGLPERGSYCINSPVQPYASERCDFRWGDRGQSDIQDEPHLNRLALDNSTFFFPVRQLLCESPNYLGNAPDPSQRSSDDRCGAYVPGTSTLAIFDRHHLTIAGALYLWPYLCSMFESNGLIA
eukprot:6630349-Prymnesium_polylepis.1